MGTNTSKARRSSDTREEQQPTVKRLKFFTDFLSAENLSLEDAATIIGMTRPSVSHWISVDDARLDLIQDIIEACDYEFEIFLSRDEKEVDGSKRISIDDFVTLDKKEYRPKRLSFLTLALLRYDIGKTELARSLGLGYTSVRYWFSSDTILLSNLFAICEAWNLSIRISMRKKSVQENPAPTGKQKRLYTVQIQKETVMNL